MSKVLCSTYTFYKWNKEDTIDNILPKCDDNEDTIHTMVSFCTDKVILTKTSCKMFDFKKHILHLSYKDFVDMVNKGDMLEGTFYDWEEGDDL